MDTWKERQSDRVTSGELILMALQVVQILLVRRGNADVYVKISEKYMCSSDLRMSQLVPRSERRSLTAIAAESRARTVMDGKDKYILL
ncbi:hypothetical protein E2C01_098113 [Portunus trituberculatus]|uniref:Uncharacterized protein n=1 Tax=Portunus trituberculatus TaxID=210409 RepID=A0A5B7K7E6_PORTR|nr:hypothetical protein [Portunus trituberculatus]